MARFYGTIKGARGEASRLGGKASGLRTVAAAWSGAVSVELYEHEGADWAKVSLMPWRNSGTSRVLYDGPVSGKGSTQP